MIVLGIIGGVVMLALLVGLYVWTRRSEREFDVPTRELTDAEKQVGVVQKGVAGNIMGGMGGGVG